MKTLPLLAGLTATLLGLTGHAQAQYTIDADHQQIIDTVQAVGVRVYVDPAQCEGKPKAGYFNGQTLGLCTKYNRNQADYLDTIRHEAIHVAQRCEAVTQGVFNRLAPINPRAVELGHILKGKAVSQYPIDVQDVEAEAWYSAHAYSAKAVDYIVRESCSFAF